MPDASTVINLRGFKGLNIASDPHAIDETELTQAKNVNIGNSGEVVKRSGLERLHSGSTLGANSVLILGHFLTDTISQLIVKAGSTVYYSVDGINFTAIGSYSDATWGVQYAGNFYIIRSGNVIVQWTGSVASNIAGSPTGTYALIHKERMFVLNTNAAGTLSSRLYFSNAGDVSATGWPGTNFFDIQPGDGDFLTGLAVVQDTLLIFKGKGTWALYIQGSLTDWVVRSINTEVGCISKHAIRQIQGFLYISSYQGIFRTDGVNFIEISDSIESEFRDRIVNLTTINIDAFGVWGDQLICLISPNSGTKVYYVYHFRLGTWTQWEFASGLLPQTFTEVRSTSLGVGLFMGDGGLTGYVLRYGSQVFTDAGVLYEVSIKTKEFDLDLPTRYKRGKWVGIDCSGVAVLSLTNTADHEEQDTFSVSSLDHHSLIRAKGPGFFRIWQFEVTFTSESSWTLIGILMHMTIHRTLTTVST